MVAEVKSMPEVSVNGGKMLGLQAACGCVYVYLEGEGRFVPYAKKCDAGHGVI